MAAITAVGDDMSPLIMDGDVVLIDLSQTVPISGKLYAVMLDDQRRFRRVFTGSDAWERYAGSHEGVDYEAWRETHRALAVAAERDGNEWKINYPERGTPFSVLGRVIWLGRDMKNL